MTNIIDFWQLPDDCFTTFKSLKNYLSSKLEIEDSRTMTKIMGLWGCTINAQPKDNFNNQLKVSKFQNEFMKSSFLPKYEQKNVSISAL